MAALAQHTAHKDQFGDHPRDGFDALVRDALLGIEESYVRGKLGAFPAGEAEFPSGLAQDSVESQQCFVALRRAHHHRPPAMAAGKITQVIKRDGEWRCGFRDPGRGETAASWMTGGTPS